MTEKNGRADRELAELAAQTLLAGLPNPPLVLNRHAARAFIASHEPEGQYAHVRAFIWEAPFADVWGAFAWPTAPEQDSIALSFEISRGKLEEGQ